MRQTKPNQASYLERIIGFDLVTERKSRKLTQKQLAEILGVENYAVSRWEDGTRFPRPEHLVGLLEFLCQAKPRRSA